MSTTWFSFLTTLTSRERLKSLPLCTIYGKVEFVKITTIAFSTCKKKKEPIIKETNRNKIENIGIGSFIKYTLIFCPFSLISSFLDCLTSFQNYKKVFFSNELCILCFIFKCIFCYCAFTSLVQFYPVSLISLFILFPDMPFDHSTCA